MSGASKTEMAEIFGAIQLLMHENELEPFALVTRQYVELMQMQITCCQMIKNSKNKRDKYFKININKFQYYMSIPKRFDDFKEHFRMSKSTFEILLSILVTKREIRKFNISYDVQLMMTLWVLATPDSYRSIGERFKVNKGVVHYLYVSYIDVIFNLAKDYIKWPSQEERKSICKVVEDKSGFPDVIGFIDGTYINIKPPKESTRYYNRKSHASLILQAVCDHKLMFRDIYFGEVGSLHDSRVYRKSPLGQKLDTNANVYIDDGHLLGDSAYCLKKTMMTPYRDDGHLTDEQRHYNYVHSSIRNAIERSFGLLKNKWRRLKYMDSNNFTYITRHVVSCCVLHNFILQAEDCEESEINVTDRTDNVILNVQIIVDENDESRQKRDRIAVALYERTYCI